MDCISLQEGWFLLASHAYKKPNRLCLNITDVVHTDKETELLKCLTSLETGAISEHFKRTGLEGVRQAEGQSMNVSHVVSNALGKTKRKAQVVLRAAHSF